MPRERHSGRLPTLTMPAERAVLATACRTPIGALGGALAAVPAPRLGAAAIGEAVRRAGMSPQDVDEVFMGQVLTAGAGQAPARQAAIGAGLPDSVPCTTVNKVCGSGLQAVILAARAVLSGDAAVAVAGGMESMSNAPYLLTDARRGFRYGHRQVADSVIVDGLWDVYNDFHMGDAAELIAREYRIDRAAQDAYAERSYRRALGAQRDGRWDAEIVPVTVDDDRPPVTTDEEPGRADFDRMALLRPAFSADGTVTAANASSLNDGAAACVVMTEGRAADLGITPLAALVAHGSVAAAPARFLVAPALVVPAMLDRAGLVIDDIDRFEINEAFAAGNLAVERDLGIDGERTNVDGGAVALGHPIGASGARILTTLLHSLAALPRGRAVRGVAALCIGGGEACGVVVERDGS